MASPRIKRWHRLRGIVDVSVLRKGATNAFTRLTRNPDAKVS